MHTVSAVNALPLCNVPVAFQAAALLPACKIHPRALPFGPLRAKFKSVHDRFVTHPSDLSKRLGMSELGAWLQLEIHGVHIGGFKMTDLAIWHASCIN
ncbi:Uncharacterised protein [Serratia plymuthica]|uniref:Uncharacterized protein n=1 Tax=Serratia plymuthica TaxID=82996 RepID=A0A2X4XQW5_SERPL|nr:Uncharacterised protein [Serratia plymuthica]